ncbi:hypothetical protein KQI88_15960 [Alkaliphilus sp. MSJ-5]|uniref:Uncharacterized protein n=1 Tax=Alkaliphilus flagellatus TaxID=2841507 RepID=A0ABS6G6B7_9FIRM|nr:hypothetical protein [Alkaliphilus flagellatus]MBU5677913.1 hypothetical protein [Alkaliphilus flagellatus]
MDAVFYWDMTYSEIIASIEGAQRKAKLEMQFNASLVYKLGSLIGVAVNDPKKYPSTSKEAFPKLFDDLVEDTSKQQPWQVMKERLNDYNAYLKRKRGENA